MTIWMARAGKHGEHEDLALENGVAVIGWSELSDLTGIITREALQELCKRVYAEEKTKTISHWVSQIWSFVGLMQEGDLVTLPLKTRSAIAIGRITGPYQYREDLPPDARHTRSVEWIKTDIPRTSFDQDILY